ncbi:MAG: amino acid ABC transporter permease, partial [Ruthenibacterium sp.]
VPGGQMEAARAVGMTHWQAMRHVVLPQAVRNILPAMANEFVTIIKETSVLSIIGVADIMFRTGDVTSITYFYFEPYIIAALLYFVVVFPLSKLVALFERRMNKSVTR